MSGVDVIVPAACSYGYNAFTLPAYRGRGIYPAIAQAEVSTCRAQGFTRGISFTEVYNFSSLEADKKFGNTRVGLAGYLRLGKRLVTFRSPAVKRLGMQFVAR